MGKDGAANGNPVLTRLREICLSLPETKETLTWGKPHFRVGEKIFAGYGEENGKSVIGFKLEMDHADARVANDRRFSRAPYVGHKGWVSMDAQAVKDWGELQELLIESYRLIAPKKASALRAEAAASAAPPSPMAKGGIGADGPKRRPAAANVKRDAKKPAAAKRPVAMAHAKKTATKKAR